MPSNECKFDFNDLYAEAEILRDLRNKVESLEIYIHAAEAEITLEMTSNPKFFVGGKRPAQTFIDNTYKYTGFDNSLLPKRLELAELKSEYIFHEVKFDAMKKEIDKWRTESANERRVL